MTHVLLLFADTADPVTAIEAALGTPDAERAATDALGEQAVVDVITASAPAETLPGVRRTLILGASPAAIDRVRALALLRSRLATAPAGRLLNSLGPVDTSRVFSRTLRADKEALAMSDGGTVVIAVDLAAARAASGLLRSGRATRAFWGLRGAFDELRRERR